MWCNQPLAEFVSFSKENAPGRNPSDSSRSLRLQAFGSCQSRDEDQVLTKELVSNGDVWLRDSKFLTKRMSCLEVKPMFGYVTQNCSKRVSLRKKSLGCKRWKTTECLLEAWRWWSAPNAETRERRPKNGNQSISRKGHAQWSVAAPKRRHKVVFCIQRASPAVNQARVCVGRASTCDFSLDSTPHETKL